MDLREKAIEAGKQYEIMICAIIDEAEMHQAKFKEAIEVIEMYGKQEHNYLYGKCARDFLTKIKGNNEKN